MATKQLCTFCLASSIDELVEEEGGVGGAAVRLRMELHSEVRQRFVTNSFIGVIVRIAEVRLPAFGQCGDVYCIAVVLRSNIAPLIKNYCQYYTTK